MAVLGDTTITSLSVLTNITEEGISLRQKYMIPSGALTPNHIPAVGAGGNDLFDSGIEYTDIAGAGIFFGVCSTAAATAAKTVTLSRGNGFTLTTGVTVLINFTNANTASSPTLNVNGTGAKAMMQYGTTAMSTTSSTTGWYAGAMVELTYNGTNWVRTQWVNSTYNYYSIYCTTSAATAAKVGSITGTFSLDAGKNFNFRNYYANTAKSALTLNIGSTGAKPIYINGTASSTTNYTLPAGVYDVYYDGTNYYFYTDGTIRAKQVVADNAPMLLTLSGDSDVLEGDDFANYYTNPHPAHTIYHSGQKQYYYLQKISSGATKYVYYVCPSSTTSSALRDTIEVTPTGYWNLYA